MKLSRIAVLVAGLLALGASAQTWPSRTIRIVVPNAAGGGSDLIARAIQEPLSRALGVPVIVDNRAGSGGAIGTAEVAAAAPDGYTLLVGQTGTNAVLPLLQKSARYDPVRDFSAIARLGTSPIVVVGRKGLAVDLAGALAEARKNPKGLNYGHAGNGTLGHLSAELLSQAAGVSMTGVAYKGQAPAVAAVLSGEVDLAFGGTSGALDALVKEGRAVMLGVTTAEPSPLVPGVAPIARHVPGYAAELWYGLFAPAKTPEAVVQRLNAEVRKALELPDVKQRFAGFLTTPAPSSPQEMSAIVVDEIRRWKPIVQRANIQEN